jgi:hypothetical protein
MLDGIVDGDFKRGRRWDMRGKPTPGAPALVLGLLEKGYDVVVASSFVRVGRERGRDAKKLEGWLRRNGLPGSVRVIPRRPLPRRALTMSDLSALGVVRINHHRFELEVT